VFEYVGELLTNVELLLQMKNAWSMVITHIIMQFTWMQIGVFKRKLMMVKHYVWMGNILGTFQGS
jgi:hypothetical protein